MQIDLRVLELLASKLCHDLISPVSAINNGVELIEDIGGSVVDEAMKLIGDSADQASRRLRLLRMAYGRAGSEENFTIRDAKQIAEQYVAGGKISLNWPDNALSESFAAHRGALKTLVNFIILGEEILAYGGSLSVHPPEDVNNFGCRLEITGRAAHLNPSFQEALEGTAAIEDLTPRSIQAYMTGRFASHFDITVQHLQPVVDRLDFVLSANAT